MAALALRSFSYWTYAYRRTWRGSVVATVVAPVLYLAAMGVGLGSVVNAGTGAGRGSLGGIPYLDFVAPGLLAATVMQTTVSESTYPVIGSIKWQKQYLAMLATPLRVVDVLGGHVLWIAARTALVAAVNLAILACFGVLHRPEAVLALPAAVLLGMAFSTPAVAFSAGRESDAAFPVVFRLVVIPLFLFSGTFFPITQLPVGLQWLAEATPLWHGTDLCRSLVLGTATLGTSIVHVVYLLVLLVLGLVWARRVYDRRLAR